MTETQFARGWKLLAEPTPPWLFLVLERQANDYDSAPPLTDAAWELATRLALKQIVLEHSAGVIFTSHLVGQLVLLHRRSHYSGGLLRICNFSQNNYDVLTMMQLGNRFCNYASREAAMQGRR
jgi:hypothetical protein